VDGAHLLPGVKQLDFVFSAYESVRQRKAPVSGNPYRVRNAVFYQRFDDYLSACEPHLNHLSDK